MQEVEFIDPVKCRIVSILFICMTHWAPDHLGFCTTQAFFWLSETDDQAIIRDRPLFRLTGSHCTLNSYSWIGSLYNIIFDTSCHTFCFYYFHHSHMHISLCPITCCHQMTFFTTLKDWSNGGSKNALNTGKLPVWPIVFKENFPWHRAGQYICFCFDYVRFFCFLLFFCVENILMNNRNDGHNYLNKIHVSKTNLWGGLLRGKRLFVCLFASKCV